MLEKNRDIKKWHKRADYEGILAVNYHKTQEPTLARPPPP